MNELSGALACYDTPERFTLPMSAKPNLPLVWYYYQSLRQHLQCNTRPRS